MKNYSWLEKKGNHTYQLHVWWDGNKQSLANLKTDGFTPICEGSDEFVGNEYTFDNPYFEFGVSLYECFYKIIQDDLAARELCLNFYSEGEIANINREVELKPDDATYAFLANIGIDRTLYLVAQNYNKELVYEANEKYNSLDKNDFLKWLKDNIQPRFSGPERYSLWKLFFTIEASRSAKYAVINEAWATFIESPDEYEQWKSTHQSITGKDIEILLSGDTSKTADFIALALFCEGELCPILFNILNNSSVPISVRRFIQDSLTEYAKEDDMFAKTLQEHYSEYQRYAGGRDICFTVHRELKQAFKSQENAVPDTQYYKQLTSPTDENKIESLFSYLCEKRYLKDEANQHDLFMLRLTGQAQYSNLVNEKLRWYDSQKMLSALIKAVAKEHGFFKKSESFFNVVSLSKEEPYDSYDASNTTRGTEAFQEEVATILATGKIPSR